MEKISVPVKPWLIAASMAFIACALLGVALRYLRLNDDHDIHHLASVDIYSSVVLLEHYLAGLGLTALASTVFTTILWAADPKQPHAPVKAWFATILLAAILHLFGIYLFEASQSYESVYGGLPRGYIQIDQVISGMLGVMMFV